jgi:hypothetical protein
MRRCSWRGEESRPRCAPCVPHCAGGVNARGPTRKSAWGGGLLGCATKPPDPRENAGITPPTPPPNLCQQRPEGGGVLRLGAADEQLPLHGRDLGLQLALLLLRFRAGGSPVRFGTRSASGAGHATMVWGWIDTNQNLQVQSSNPPNHKPLKSQTQPDPTNPVRRKPPAQAPIQPNPASPEPPAPTTPFRNPKAPSPGPTFSRMNSRLRASSTLSTSSFSCSAWRFCSSTWGGGAGRGVSRVGWGEG